MNFNAKSFLCLALAQAIFISGCATVKVHPEFNERHKEMESAAILPPDAQVVEVTFNAGNKPLADVTDNLKKVTAESITEVLKRKGYEVKDIQIDEKSMESDPKLKEAFFNIQTLYQKALKDIAENKKKDFTYSVGSSASFFAERSGANALIMVREVGSKLSQGQQAAEVVKLTGMIVTAALLGVSAGHVDANFSLGIEISVIDADLGDVLWYNLKTANDNFSNPGDAKVIKQWVTDILAPLPDSAFKKGEPLPSKPRKTRPTNFGSTKTATPVKMG